MTKILKIAIALVAVAAIQAVATALAATLGADPFTANALSVGFGAAALVSFLG